MKNLNVNKCFEPFTQRLEIGNENIDAHQKSHRQYIAHVCEYIKYINALFTPFNGCLHPSIPVHHPYWKKTASCFS